MKKFKLSLILVAIVISISQFGCSNEVEVIGVWKDIPVVYGIIDATKDTNYIRIERAYLPPNQSALEVAKNPDSIYFNPADVDIQMYRIAGSDTIPWATPLERVDLAAEGIQRDSGIFANNPAYAYRIIGRTFANYHLVINNLKTGNTFSATTEAIDVSNTFITTRPAYSPFSKPVVWVEKTNGDYEYKLFTIDMTPSPFASIFDVGILFFYKEFEIDATGNMIPGTEQEKVFDWKARRNYIPENQFDVNISGLDFYSAIQAHLSDVSGSNIRRCAGGIEIYVEGASQSLANYIAAVEANTGFVGGLYPADPFSNVTEGYGFLAASNRLERSANIRMTLSNDSYEYFSDGELLQNKGFNFNTTPCL